MRLTGILFPSAGTRSTQSVATAAITSTVIWDGFHIRPGAEDNSIFVVDKRGDSWNSHPMMNEAATPDLTSYDFIVINTSAGKDSQAMLDYVMGLVRIAGITDRVVAVHCDLGRVEWPGTKELAEKQCQHYGIPLQVVRREKGDLLVQVEQRGMWPDNKNRYCTSDQKRDQVAKVHTALATQRITEIAVQGQPKRQVRILNCLGLRAEESPARAKKIAFQSDKRLTNGKRQVDIWLPIHEWTTQQVWATIKASGVPYHYAYDSGMPRLSCMFCIFAPKDALVIAGRANPALLDEYVAIEAKIGHTFRNGFKIAEVKEAIEAGYQTSTVLSWNM